MRSGSVLLMDFRVGCVLTIPGGAGAAGFKLSFKS